MPDLSDPVPSDPDLVARIQRLEESVGFSQHDAESLTAQMLDLDARLRSLAARLARVESLLPRQDQPETAPADPASPDSIAPI